jgi:hypothetical protein
MRGLGKIGYEILPRCPGEEIGNLYAERENFYNFLFSQGNFRIHGFFE